jgi:hypothetical protein
MPAKPCATIDQWDRQPERQGDASAREFITGGEAISGTAIDAALAELLTADDGQ